MRRRKTELVEQEFYGEREKFARLLEKVRAGLRTLQSPEDADGLARQHPSAMRRRGLGLDCRSNEGKEIVGIVRAVRARGPGRHGPRTRGESERLYFGEIRASAL